MIVAEAFGATGTLSERFVTVPGYIDVLGDKMSRAIVGEATARGVTLHVDDLVLWRSGQDDVAQTIEYSMVWAPDPMTRGIEFFGGSHDGEVMMQIARNDGPGRAYPPREIRVMSEPATSFEGEPVEIEPVALIEDYERVGVDPLKRRFIYKITN